MISIAEAWIPAATTPETAAPAWSVESKAASTVRTASGRRSRRSVTSVAIPSVPSEPTNTPSRSGPGESLVSRTVVAVGKHDEQRRDVVRGEPVLEAVRAARVLGDVAADRADLLAGRVGRVVPAVGDHRLGHLEVRHAGLDRDPRRVEVDVQDLVHPRERDHDAVGDRQRAARRAPSRRRARRTGRPPRRTP